MILLAQFAAVCVQYQWQVVVARDGQTQTLRDVRLLEARSQQIRAAHDFGDAHCLLVNRTGKLVGDLAVAPPHDEISDLTEQSSRNRADGRVFNGQGRVGKPHSERPRSRAQAEVATGPGVDRLVQSRRRSQSQFRASTTATVEATLDEETLQDSLVGFDVLALPPRRLVPVQPMCFELAQDGRLRSRYDAVLVEVVDPQ